MRARDRGGPLMAAPPTHPDHLTSGRKSWCNGWKRSLTAEDAGLSGRGVIWQHRSLPSFGYGIVVRCPLQLFSKNSFAGIAQLAERKSATLEVARSLLAARSSLGPVSIDRDAAVL